MRLKKLLILCLGVVLHLAMNTDYGRGQGYTKVAQALQRHDLKAAKKLLRTGASPDDTIVGGKTPLYFAINNDDTIALNLLLQYHADLHKHVSTLVKSYQEEPFEMAARLPALRCLEILTKKLSAISTKNELNSLLGVAAWRGLVPTMETLIEAGADINAEDTSTKGTALFAAVDQGHADAADYAIRNGADVNHSMAHGFTPLFNAVILSPIAPDQTTDQESKEYKKIILSLLTHGAQVDAVDDRGRTALYMACKYCETTYMQILIDHGANPDKPDAKGITPRQVASDSGCAIPATTHH